MQDKEFVPLKLRHWTNEPAKVPPHIKSFSANVLVSAPIRKLLRSEIFSAGPSRNFGRLNGRNRQPNALRHSPEWLPQPSFDTHMARLREAAASKKTESEAIERKIIPPTKKKQNLESRESGQFINGIRGASASYNTEIPDITIRQPDANAVFPDSGRRQWRPSVATDERGSIEPSQNILAQFPGPSTPLEHQKKQDSQNLKPGGFGNINTNTQPLIPSLHRKRFPQEQKNDATENDKKIAEKTVHPYASNLYYTKIGDQELHDLDVIHHLDDDTVKIHPQIADDAISDSTDPNLTAFTGELVSSAPSQSTPEYLRWPAPVNMEPLLPWKESPSSAFFRYRAPQDRFFQAKSNDIIYDNWWVSWSRAAGPRSTSALVATELGFVSGGVGLRDDVTEINTGWKDIAITEYTNRVNEEVSIGAAKGQYGVFVDRSNLARATAIEVIARNFASSALVDFSDRDYGYRISIRNFDISLRHDFDEFINPDVAEFATEVLISYKGIGMALSTDVGASKYGLTVGWKGRQISILHDFDERTSDLLLNWGRGWQALLETDFMDPHSHEIYTRLGVGRLGRSYLAVGAGVGNDGVPEASFETHAPDVGLFVKLLDVRGNRQLQTAVAIGKFTYMWEFSLALQNLRIPNFFGLNPEQVKHFLLGSPPVVA